MPTTSHFSFPYPSLTDAPNGPSQIQQLAAAIDTYLFGLPLVQSGVVNVTPTGAGVYSTAPVTFPVSFSAPPTVTVTPIAAGTGTISSAGSDTPTASGCNVGIIRTNTTVTAVQWVAVGPR